jgi:hypothetical protein
MINLYLLVAVRLFWMSSFLLLEDADVYFILYLLEVVRLF